LNCNVQAAHLNVGSSATRGRLGATKCPQGVLNKRGTGKKVGVFPARREKGPPLTKRHKGGWRYKTRRKLRKPSISSFGESPA